MIFSGGFQLCIDAEATDSAQCCHADVTSPTILRVTSARRPFTEALGGSVEQQFPDRRRREKLLYIGVFGPADRHLTAVIVRRQSACGAG